MKLECIVDVGVWTFAAHHGMSPAERKPVVIVSTFTISSLYVVVCCCTDWFVSYQMGNPIDRFSLDEAQNEMQLFIIEVITPRTKDIFM